jgi:phage/plasmid-like protein (TIGR03299 family)
MSHEVETMYYTSNEANGRFVPWHGLGTPVAEALNSADALKTAGLDWTVEQTPVYTNELVQIPNYKANVRSSDKSVLGIVTDRYKIVQNAEAFAFTDELIGGDVRYETAGSLRNGRTIWLLAKMPSAKLLDDVVDPYLCFTNSHDGTGAVKICLTPIRVVCNNTLNFALNNAKRSWQARHTTSIDTRLHEAERTLELADKYMIKLSKEAERLANSPLTFSEVNEVLDELFPLEESASDRQKENVKNAKDEILICYFAPDIKKFVDPTYGFMNAISDWCGHAKPTRQTAEYADNNWGRIMNGHPVFDKAYELVLAK